MTVSDVASFPFYFSFFLHHCQRSPSLLLKWHLQMRVKSGRRSISNWKRHRTEDNATGSIISNQMIWNVKWCEIVAEFEFYASALVSAALKVTLYQASERKTWLEYCYEEQRGTSLLAFFFNNKLAIKGFIKKIKRSVCTMWRITAQCGGLFECL